MKNIEKRRCNVMLLEQQSVPGQVMVGFMDASWGEATCPRVMLSPCHVLCIFPFPSPFLHAGNI